MGINPDNGEILWNYNIVQFHKGESGKGGITLTPIFHNGEIFTNSGYDHPALMFTLAKDGRSVTLKWKNDIFDTHHGGVVLIDGNLYGSNMQDLTKGKWVSVNWGNRQNKLGKGLDNQGFDHLCRRNVVLL